MDLILRAVQRNRRVAQDLKTEWKELLLATCGVGVCDARRRAVKNCLEGVSIFCAWRNFIRCVAQMHMARRVRG
ncbi:hypothetical protein A2U01_0031839 [Trifolium medium]|uniref:Uncharacterized protein n=1 Tax=Trifolium medium TaxID=97028 RepID=A0A392PG26_9FABA|nr:hypothetical protein [Trifolium medium]